LLVPQTVMTVKGKKLKLRSACAVVTPSNVSDAMNEFLCDPSRCPSWNYKRQDAVVSRALSVHKNVHTEYLDIALHIVREVIGKFGSESEYLKQAGGNMVSADEVEVRVQNYINSNRLNRIVRVKQKDVLTGATMNMHAPNNWVMYISRRGMPENFIEGCCHHEIGTHCLRGVNEQSQVWHHKRKKYNVQTNLKTEEGLACLNTQLSLDPEFRYLWKAALHYVAVCRGEHMSFSELFDSLEEFIDDKERRYRQCVRVKRGLQDHSEQTVFCRDQAYLIGAVNILRAMHTISDIRVLYCGLVSLSSLDRVRRIARPDSIKLPPFLRGHQNSMAYLEALEGMASLNNITENLDILPPEE
jgi:hypothetical protein